MTPKSLTALAQRLRDPDQYVDACDEAADLIEALARLWTLEMLRNAHQFGSKV